MNKSMSFSGSTSRDSSGGFNNLAIASSGRPPLESVAFMDGCRVFFDISLVINKRGVDVDPLHSTCRDCLVRMRRLKPERSDMRIMLVLGLIYD